MKIKVSEATPRQIDWLVAKIEGLSLPVKQVEPKEIWINVHPSGHDVCAPSTDPAQGQPILEREKLVLEPRFGGDGWQAHKRFRMAGPCLMHGPTMLIAGLRCYLASCLGDEVEVPEELT